MRHKILQIDDANMAGFEWSYSFWLNRTRARSLTLTLTQSTRGDLMAQVDPVQGLRNGVELYRALDDMMSEVGYVLDESQVEQIALEIARVDPRTAEEFRTAPSAIEAEDEAAQRAEAERQEAVLAPFAAQIDAYVQRFSNEKLHYPGAGLVYPSRRHWAMAFLRQYVLAHGVLPTGKHWIRVQGYSGGEHDFSDLVEAE